MTDFPDFQTEAAAAAAIGVTDLRGTGLTIDPVSGGTVATGAHIQALHTGNTPVGLEAAQSMLAAVAGVTTELAALIATGSASGAPGGVPLLRQAKTVSTGSQAVAAGASLQAVSGAAFVSPSFSMRLILTAGAAGALMFGQVTLQWQEGATTVAQKSFQVAASTGGHQITISGPVRATNLNVTFATPTGSTASITYTWSIYQESRLAVNDLCRTLTSMGTGPPTTFTWAGLNMDFGVMCNGAPSIGIGATAHRGLAMYNGTARLHVKTASGTTDCEVILQDLGELAAGDVMSNYGTIYRNWTDAHGDLNDSVTFPNVQCELVLINHSAAAQVISHVFATGEPNVN